MVVVDGVEMIDVREAAALAGRTPETVRRWVWSGRLACRRSGNRLLIARADVERISAGSVPSLPAPASSLQQWAEEARQLWTGDETGPPPSTSSFATERNTLAVVPVVDASVEVDWPG